MNRKLCPKKLEDFSALLFTALTQKVLNLFNYRHFHPSFCSVGHAS
jgi:hypothetical protein